MADQQLRVVTVDLRCCCGAKLFVEWPLESNYVTHATDLAKAFIVAHKCEGKKVDDG